MSNPLVVMGRRLARATRNTVRDRLRGQRMHPRWGLRLEVLARLMRTGNDAKATDLLRSRRAIEGMAISSPLGWRVRRERAVVGGVSGVWFTPRGLTKNAPVILWMHGGGYILGNSRTHGELSIRLALASRARLFLPEYRLAPEDPWPAAVDDAVAAYEGLITEVPPDRIVVGGDSAGGGLTLVMLARLRDAGVALPAGGILLSPWADLGERGGTMVSHEPYDWISPVLSNLWGRAYAGEADLRHPEVSPLYADLRGLPPLFVEVATAELLLDQVRALVDKLLAEGVTVHSHEWPDMIHDAYFLAPVLGQVRRRFPAMGAFVRERVALAG